MFARKINDQWTANTSLAEVQIVLKGLHISLSVNMKLKWNYEELTVEYRK